MQPTKKERIRESAVTMFARMGFHATTTDKIAAEAGVSVGTIYNYFRSKEAILEYIFQVELEKRQRFFETLKDSKEQLPNLILPLLDMHFRLIREDPDVGMILIRERQSSHIEELEFVDQFIQGVPSAIAGLLRNAQERGEIREVPVRLIAAAFFGAVEGVVREAVFHKDPAERERLLIMAPQELTTLLLQGLQIADHGVN